MLRNSVCLVTAHIKNRGNSVLNPRLWDYVYQFVYRHNKDL